MCGNVSLRRDRGGDPRAAGDGPEQSRRAPQDARAVCRHCLRGGHHAVHLVAQLSAAQRAVPGRSGLEVAKADSRTPGGQIEAPQRLTTYVLKATLSLPT